MMIARTLKLALLGMMVSGLSKTLFGDVQYTFTAIEDPSASTRTQPTGINNSGQIVGYYVDSATSAIYGFLYNGGGFAAIDYPGSNHTTLVGINNSGQILGANLTPSPALDFIYSGGNFTPILTGGPSGTGSASGFNDSDQIVGYPYNGANGFLYSDGTYTQISDPNGATGINNSGQIVGFYIDSTGHSNGFLYSDGGFTTIDYPGAANSELDGINNLGQIVGYYSDPSGPPHPFLYSDGNFTAINVPNAIS